MDIGAELRAAREAKGLSIGTLAQRTRVHARTLAAIELNNLAALPPRPFGRGFVRAFAQEVDLDPDRTVHSYFSQFPATLLPAAPVAARRAKDFSGPASQWAGLAMAATIFLVVVSAAIVLGRRTEPSVESTAVGTSGSTAPALSPTSAPVAVQPVASTPPATVAPLAPLRFTFTVSGPCWVSANVDGERTIYRILQAGDRQALNAQREILIRFGDASAVAWTLNGRNGAPLGTAGAVRDLHITPDNAATIR